MKSWLAAVTGFRREAKARKDANTRRPADGLPRPRRITAKGLSPRSFAAFCSSFMVAKGLDEITIGGLDQMMTRYATHLSGREWCWLVFALFHETAQNSVTSLIVKVEELLLADILSIRQMIRSPRPLEKLLDPSTSQSRLPSSQTLPAQVVLRDGAQIRLDDLNGPAVQSGTPQSATHEVMNGSVEGFDILVPGYGQCWAQRADVLAEVPRRDANDGNQWRLKTHSVTRLALSVNGSHVANRDRGIAALLRLIGTPITHLSLKSLADGVFDQSYLDLLWLCCPNLTYLHVSPITLGSLDDLIEAYAPGHCQVSSLCLGRCIVSDSDSVLSLARTLGDPLSPVANTMRELSLDFEEVRNPTTDEMLEAFLLVLEMNDRLLYLTLTVTDTQYDRFNERFLVFNGQYMRWKLPIQAKCAFLSVVKHAQRANAKTSGTKCRAVGNLDSLALSIILFMASERHLRSVILDSLTEQGGVDFCEQLRALELPLTPDEGDEDEEATWFRHCEAVELLLLASLVDPKGFTEMVWGHCANKEEIPRECFGYNPVMPCRLRLVISTFNDIERVFAKTKTLLTPRSTHSDKFNTTLTTLLRMGEEKQLDLEEAVIPVTIALSFLDERHANHLLSLLVEYQRTKDTHSDHLKDCRFVMDDVELDISGVSISGGLIDVVELFKSTPGLRFRTINLPLFQPHYDLTAAIYERRRIPWR